MPEGSSPGGNEPQNRSFDSKVGSSVEVGMSELAKTASLEVPQTGEEVRYWPEFLGWVIHFVEPMAKCLSGCGARRPFHREFSSSLTSEIGSFCAGSFS